jgi:hypothetical protein
VLESKNDEEDLQENLKNLKIRCKPTPSFRLKNSLHITSVRGSQDSNNHLRTIHNFNNSDDTEDEPCSPSNPTKRKDFLVRMTP